MIKVTPHATPSYLMIVAGADMESMLFASIASPCAFTDADYFLEVTAMHGGHGTSEFRLAVIIAFRNFSSQPMAAALPPLEVFRLRSQLLDRPFVAWRASLISLAPG